MACCLMATSHYLNQCWLIMDGVPWHSPKSNFTESVHDTNSQNLFENALEELFPHLPETNESMRVDNSGRILLSRWFQFKVRPKVVWVQFSLTNVYAYLTYRSGQTDRPGASYSGIFFFKMPTVINIFKGIAGSAWFVICQRTAKVYWDAFFSGQPGSVSKFPPFLWVKLWVEWVGRGYIEIRRYFPALWINRVTLITKIKLWYSLGY